MHESITMALVGDMLKVSGSRMATPLAPPRPGSTPISTPSTMPMNISSRFIGVEMTAKPWKRELISSMVSRVSLSLSGARSVAEEAQGVEHSLEQGNLEPHLEHHEEQRAHGQRHDHALHPGVLAQDDHEQRDVQEGG